MTAGFEPTTRAPDAIGWSAECILDRITPYTCVTITLRHDNTIYENNLARAPGIEPRSPAGHADVNAEKNLIRLILRYSTTKLYPPKLY